MARHEAIELFIHSGHNGPLSPLTPAPPRASDKVVAQVSNLLYRRLPACGCAEESGVTVMATLCRLEIGDTAGWKPALRGTGRTLSVALLCRFTLSSTLSIG